MTSATEILRRLLDERGVEYYKHEDGEPLRELHEGRDDATSWRVGGANVCAVPFDDYTFDLWIDHATPSQAIDATLGRGTCKNEGDSDKFRCSACGLEMDVTDEDWEPTMWLDGLATVPHYCPNCGREIKEDAQ